MECNKEEAIRAKELAEKKMQTNDFIGAQRIGLKAKQLFPQLENISHLLAVCDVHCSSQKKVYGPDLDWYGILQVERMADEATIRKQYRKLALLLHPDKNKLAGAEAAFKLIGQANTVLSDRWKRSLYDMKVQVSVGTTLPKAPARQVNRNAPVRKQNGAPSVAKAQSTSANVHQQASSFANGQRTFWTRCDTCRTRYQYYRNVMNKILVCTICSKVFTAFELAAEGVPQAYSASQPVSLHQKDVPTGCGGTNSQSTFCRPTSGEGVQAAFSSKTAGSGPVLKTGRTDDVSSGTAGKRRSNESVDPLEFSRKTAGSESVLKTGSSSESDVGLASSCKERSNECAGQGGFSRKAAFSESVLKTGSTADFGLDFKSKVGKDENVHMGDQKEAFSVPKPDVEKCEKQGASGKANKKRGRKMVLESMESSGTASIDETEGDSIIQENGGLNSGHNGCYYPRRSSRKKCSVSYNETEDDNDFVNPPKVSKIDTSSNASEQGMKEGGFSHMMDGEEEIYQNENVPLGQNMQTAKSEATECRMKGEAEKFVCPDSQFSNFGKAEKCYAVGQIWAIYDWVDGMPRFYAHVKKVHSRGFKLKITWLEPHPYEQGEIAWVGVGLPVACGRYKLGHTQDTSDHDMFSHQVKFEKGNGRGSYMIHPRKGDTWALFKNWDMSWNSEPDNHKEFELEIVEVLEDFVEGAGVMVAYLDKVKGFVSLFQQTTREGAGSFKISPKEQFRFSHQIPSFRLSGRKIEGVPEGSFELDPAALNSIFTGVDQGISFPEKNYLQQDIDVRSQKDTYKESSSNCMAQDKSNEHVDAKDFSHLKAAASGSYETFHPCPADEETHVQRSNTSCNKSPKKTNIHPSLSSCGKISEVRFHNFDEARSKDKFELHQVWAVYCDLDGLPKAYVHIRKFESNPEFKLVVAMLEACSAGEEDEIVPVSCGLFKPGRKQTLAPTAFSHELKVDFKIKKFDIYPRKGEVWALYKDWRPKWMPPDLKNSLYDVVEIIDGNNESSKVLFLERVNGFTNIFKAPERHRYMKIAENEFPRFSHQIPAVLGEMNGCMGISWELDPASLPGASSC